MTWWCGLVVFKKDGPVGGGPFNRPARLPRADRPPRAATAIPPITTVRPTILDELLAAETHATVAAITSFYKNRYFIDEFHGALMVTGL